MATKVIMPQLGEGVIEGTIATWLKEEGDTVDLYEPILEIETDKVTTEATAEVAGTLIKILVPQGETVSVGTVLALIGSSDEAVDAELASSEEAAEAVVYAEPAPARGEPVAPATDGHTQSPPRPYTGRISPVVGRIAEEHGVDLSRVRGTGRNGRITKKDILAYVEQREVEAREVKVREPSPVAISAPASPEVSPAAPRPLAQAPDLVPGELVPLTSMRRTIAEHMVRSKHTSPHVTTVFELDFSAVMAHRTEHKASFARDGADLTYTVYVVSAIVQALKAHPMVNSTWTDDGIVLKKEINIGMATAIPEGLIVPVIKNADGLSLLGLARAINDLAVRARSGQLRPNEVQGGTFTLTNHGVSGSLFGTPIINQPQCAILGFGKIEKRVKVIDDAIAIRPMAYASLTFDHRILDGASGDAFMSTFKDQLEQWQ